MFVIKSSERGYFENEWLKSFHSFSFASYYNPQAMNYEGLRVVNDDIIAPHQGFDMHFHRDMEIITYVVEGAITHQDNLGNNYEISAGNFQIMSAGSGIYHSEFNLRDTPCRIIQSWIKPNSLNIKPRHALINNHLKDQFVLIASYDDGRVGHQSFENANNNQQDQEQKIFSQKIFAQKIFSLAEIYVLETDLLKVAHLSEITLPNSALTKLWIQVVEGQIALNNLEFSSGDGIGIETKLIKNSAIKILQPAKILLYFL